MRIHRDTWEDLGMVEKMYDELAKWWPLLSPPSHYVEEAEDLLPDLLSAATPPPKTLLELGSGGGSLAFHLKRHFTVTLSDLSEQMLAVSRATNPECEHVQGDMRSLDLGRTFDLVLIHDAIMYMTDADSMRATLRTVARHCRPGGACVLMPDFVKEEFEPSTDHGGEDGPDGRGLRYMDWTWDPDPNDDTFEAVYAFVLREGDSVRMEMDRHRCGMFPYATWMDWIREAGFTPSSRRDPWERTVFIGKNYAPK